MAADAAHRVADPDAVPKGSPEASRPPRESRDSAEAGPADLSARPDDGKGSLRPSRKQRQVEPKTGPDKDDPDGDSSDDDVSSSNERMERRYRTRGRRGGRRRRKNREGQEWSERDQQGFYDGAEQPQGPGWYPGEMTYFPPELTQMAQGILPYWNSQHNQPIPLNPSPGRPSNMPRPPVAKTAPPPPPPKPTVESLNVAAAPVKQAYPAAQAPAPAARDQAPAPVPQPPSVHQKYDASQNAHELLLSLLNNQVAALLPSGGPDVDRGHLMRTLLSVYEQLQVLKGALGEKTTLTLINMMMGSPSQGGGALAELRSRAGSEEPHASGNQEPELLQPTPLQPTPVQGPVLQPFGVAQRFAGDEQDGKGSPGPPERPPTESPGPMVNWIP